MDRLDDDHLNDDRLADDRLDGDRLNDDRLADDRLVDGRLVDGRLDDDRLDDDEDDVAGGERTAVKPQEPQLEGKALIKEVCRLIRAARSHWDAHHNAATRLARRRAMRLYERLTREEREQVPQVLRVWLRYRSEKYYGPRKKKKRNPR